jgi:hypothetical protein
MKTLGASTASTKKGWRGGGVSHCGIMRLYKIWGAVQVFNASDIFKKYKPWPFIWHIVGIFICRKPASLIPFNFINASMNSQKAIVCGGF